MIQVDCCKEVFTKAKQKQKPKQQLGIEQVENKKTTTKNRLCKPKQTMREMNTIQVDCCKEVFTEFFIKKTQTTGGN